MHTLHHFSLVALILCSLLMQGCSSETATTNTSASAKTKVADQTATSKLPKAHQDWLKYLSTKSDSIQFLYTENAVKILEDGTSLEGREAIANYYLSKDLAIQSIEVDTLIIANKQRALTYEIGASLDKDKAGYKHIIIWKSDANTRQREFEFFAKLGSANLSLTELDRRREEWMKLCNAHDAKNLVDKLYSDSTIYFNHKPLVRGKELLVKEYGYMNRENYELVLKPSIVYAVNENFIFEIGQCQGTYNGKYILIWRKEKDGQWNIFIDSNI